MVVGRKSNHACMPISITPHFKDFGLLVSFGTTGSNSSDKELAVLISPSVTFLAAIPIAVSVLPDRAPPAVNHLTDQDTKRRNARSLSFTAKFLTTDSRSGRKGVTLNNIKELMSCRIRKPKSTPKVESQEVV